MLIDAVQIADTLDRDRPAAREVAAILDEMLSHYASLGDPKVRDATQ